jgi:ABC-type dipeptide/oligopeptide/nickel transport system permease subunit
MDTPAPAAARPARTAQAQPRRLAARLRRNPVLFAGLALVTLLALTAVIGPALSPFDPTEPSPRAVFQAPSAAHLFGTDKFGRDVLTRVVYAARLDLGIAASCSPSRRSSWPWRSPACSAIPFPTS